MPQLQLPIFPVGTTLINANLGFMREGDEITYFYGHLPVFKHAADDSRSFLMIASQFYVNGSATQAEICRACAVTPIRLKRAVKRYRQGGISVFFAEPKRRGPGVLTPPVLKDVQELLDAGKELSEVASELDLLADTLRKAVKAGKIHKPLKKKMTIPEK